MILLLLCAAWVCLILLTWCLCVGARLGDLDLNASESLPFTRSPGISPSGQTGLGDGEESCADSTRRDDAAESPQRQVAA